MYLWSIFSTNYEDRGCSTLHPSDVGLVTVPSPLVSSNHNVLIIYTHVVSALFGKHCCKSFQQIALWMTADNWLRRGYRGCFTCTCPAFTLLRMIPRPEGGRLKRSCCNKHICGLHNSFSWRAIEFTPLVYERMAPEADAGGEGYEQCYQSVDLLRCPENIDAPDCDGKTPLYHAINNNDLEMVKALGPDLLNSEDRFHPALEWAVQSSALDVLVFLLDISSESVNKPDSDGGTIIHMAAKMNSLGVLTALLEAKSKLSINLPGKLKRSPLHSAAKAGQVQNMRYLIQKGAEVDNADDDKQTPLHMAAMYGRVKAVTVLLEAKADLDLQDSEKRTPLYLAAYNGYVDTVEILLNDNADVKLVSDGGWSPLHIAADSMEITKKLIVHGADVNLRNKDMWTPLHVAITWRKMAVAKLLVEKEANPNDGNADGNTALHLAVRENATNLVQLMLKKGANFKIRTRDGLSCLTLAVSNYSVTILDVLLDAQRHSPAGKVWDLEDLVAAYWRAIEMDYREALKVLVKKEGQLLDELSNEGFTGLDTCLYNRRDNCEEEQVAICLLNLGADPFKRRQVDQKSAFELGIISRLKPKLGFMDACLKRIPEDLSTASCLGFKELRIATELPNLDLWLRLEPLREAFSKVIDHDGWSLDHFIHQSADRLPMQPRTIPPLKPTRSPTGLVIRPMWRLPVPETEAPMRIAPSRLQVSFARKY